MVIPKIFKGRAKFRLPWVRALPQPILKIPIEFGSSEDFTTKVSELFVKQSTYIYIDTSFLMWLTKIGATSRKEFFEWIARTCPRRVCVPIWSAHEYLRHHVSKTILDELDERIKELAAIAGKTYSYLRPFMDEPLREGLPTREAQQISARSALIDLQMLAKDAEQWRTRYSAHATDVISFINSHVPGNTAVYEMFESLNAAGQVRFDGRIPPGFQDRNKQEKREKHIEGDDILEVTTGNNRWGDLLFWQEVLGLSKASRAKHIILFTNDLKNDWQFGGRATPDESDLKSIKQKWRPLPLAHPMLCLEARLAANVEDVLLIDSTYLGVYLKRHEENSTASFVDVAIVPDPPRAPTERDRRKSIVRKQKQQSNEASTNELIDTEPLFEDNSSLLNSAPILLKAWRKSKELPDAVNLVLSNIEAATLGEKSIVDAFITGAVSNLDNNDLVALARAIHDSAQPSGVGSAIGIADLISLLDQFPPKTATSIFMGIIGSMYFLPLSTDPRYPASSPCAEKIFDMQDRAFAKTPIAILNTIFKKLDNSPFYILGQESLVDISIKHVPEADGEFILGSITLLGIEIYSEAQAKKSLNFANLSNNKSKLSVEEIIDFVCAIFVIPQSKISYEGNLGTKFQIIPTAGFRSPATTYLNKEASL